MGSFGYCEKKDPPQGRPKIYKYPKIVNTRCSVSREIRKRENMFKTGSPQPCRTPVRALRRTFDGLKYVHSRCARRGGCIGVNRGA